MRTVSTGTGLVVLSATIAACFAVSHFGGEERAFAQGTQQANTATPEANTAALMSGCSSNGEVWFSSSPKTLVRCVAPIGFASTGLIGASPIGACDVNHDGTLEHFETMGDGLIFSLEAGGTRTDPVLLLSKSEPINDSYSLLVHTSVLAGSEALATNLRAIGAVTFGGVVWSVSISPIGWRDIDNDGDEDLVCVVYFRVQGGSGTSTCKLDMWFENTGYQASPPPNPYDLDQDGEVGAGDISVLLLNYSK